MKKPSVTVSGAFHPTVRNPVPRGLRGGVATTKDGKSLRYAVLEARRRPVRGTILIAQGRNEAIEKYFETIEDLAGFGFAVAAFDWRGQGGSQRLLGDPRKGHAASMDALGHDLDAVLDDVVLKRCPQPVVILAHSMGALIALSASSRLAGRVERMIFTAPLVALPHTPGGKRMRRLGARAARLMGLGSASARPYLRPGLGWTHANSPLTSDPERFERNAELAREAPHLFIDAPTIAWFDIMARAMVDLDESDVIARLSVPSLFLIAGADRIVSSPASERLAWRMRCGHSIVIPMARHEILQEADRYREPALAAIDMFLTGLPPSMSREEMTDFEAALEDVGA